MSNNTFNTKKAFNLPSDDLFLLCGLTIEGLKKGKIVSADQFMGKIKGVIGHGLLSAGYGVDSEIIPDSQEDCTLALEVYPLNGYGKKAPLGGKGIAEKGLEEFMVELDTRLKRFEIKYR